MKRLVVVLLVLFMVTLSGCPAEDIEPCEGADCEVSCKSDEVFDEENEECVSNDHLLMDAIIEDAEAVAEAAEAYCAEVTCTPIRPITYAEIKDRLDLDEEYYQFDLYEIGDGLRHVSIFNEDGEYEVLLYAKALNDYQWVDLAPIYLSDDLYEHIDTSLGTNLIGGGIIDNTRRDSVVADALAMEQAMMLYCLETTCTPGETRLTWDEINMYIAGLDIEDYWNYDQPVVYLNDDSDIEVYLIGAETGDYGWNGLAPSHYNTSADKRETVNVTTDVYEYYIMEHLSNYDQVLNRQEDQYVVYVYNLACSHCMEIRNDMIEYSTAPTFKMYAIDIQTVLGEPYYLEGEMNAVPQLVVIENGSIVEIVYGVTDVPETMEELVYGTYTGFSN